MFGSAQPLGEAYFYGVLPSGLPAEKAVFPHRASSRKQQGKAAGMSGAQAKKRGRPPEGGTPLCLWRRKGNQILLELPSTLRILRCTMSFTA